MTTPIAYWIIFNLLIAIVLGIDLVRSYRSPHAMSVKEALLASAGWIGLALLFNGWIYWRFGSEPALAFFTGYLLEKSLSVDNLFVFLLIFAHFKVPETAKHHVLFCGVLGAIVMRALLILGGIALTHQFEWIFLIFGVFLIITGARLAFKQESEAELETNRIYRYLKKTIPFTSYHGNRFFVLQNGGLFATPLLAVLFLIEITDVIFAFDSVPAILGITQDPFIAYTSNIFAVLGLRSLFFGLQGVMGAFYLLHYALAFILVFIGSKMLLAPIVHIPIGITFLVLITTLFCGVAGSLLFPRKTSPPPRNP